MTNHQRLIVRAVTIAIAVVAVGTAMTGCGAVAGVVTSTIQRANPPR